MGANRSSVVRTSFESVMEVLTFILLVYDSKRHDLPRQSRLRRWGVSALRAFSLREQYANVGACQENLDKQLLSRQLTMP